MADVTYYWNSWYSQGWDNDPDYMVDGDLETYALAGFAGDYQYLRTTTGIGTDLGTITKVELRCYAHGDGNDKIAFTFNQPGQDEYEVVPPAEADWSTYADVTSDTTVDGWTWAKVADLYGEITKQLIVIHNSTGKANDMYCAKVEIRVTYTPTAAGIYYNPSTAMFTQIADSNKAMYYDISRGIMTTLATGNKTLDITKATGMFKAT